MHAMVLDEYAAVGNLCMAMIKTASCLTTEP